MASSKRDFTDFNAFPGELDEGTGYHLFPLLWHKDDLDRWRQWQISVRLIKCSDETLSGIDWNLLEEKQIPIKDEYYEMGTIIPPSICAQAWVETGIEGGKITRSAPTYFNKPVNEGKSNERNVFQQSLIYARAQWLLKKNKGCTEKKSSKKVSSKNTMYFPMLAKTMADGKKYLEFPLYIQPKLDGNRCLAFLQKKDGGASSVIVYTRAKKPYPSADYIKKILYPYLNDLYDDEKNQSIYLDGELYKHGKRLQDISGDSRNSKANTKDTNKQRNEYHVYDCFYPLELDTPFSDRYEQLEVFYEALTKSDAEVIKRVPTILVKSMKSAEKQYDKFISLGYEGAILRNKDGPYLANPHKTGSFMRSKDLVKMKQKFTAEYEVVGYKEGSKGKDKGAVIWVCVTDKNVQFNVTPKDITYEERYNIFKDCETNFDKKYKNRMLTVEYEDLSKDSVPLRAKAVEFRDHE
jgi:hypothetical protein